MKQNSPFRYRKSRRGAVMMEYVIIAVLIAAACVAGVLVLSRATARGWGVSSRGATANHTEAASRQKASQNQTGEDAGVAEDYHDSMHK